MKTAGICLVNLHIKFHHHEYSHAHNKLPASKVRVQGHHADSHQRPQMRNTIIIVFQEGRVGAAKPQPTAIYPSASVFFTNLLKAADNTNA
jgi:hypothetical protein